MKYLLILFLALVSLNNMAQKEMKAVQKVNFIEINKPVEVKEVRKENKPIYVSSGTKTQQPEKTIEYYDNLIMAINAKIDYIKSDEVENAKALESGWFIKMNDIILNAEEEKSKLLNHKKVIAQK